MNNHSLVKLVDIALFPAALLVVSKFIGLIATVAIFNLDWAIVQFGDGLGRPVVSPSIAPADIVLASTYSDLILMVIMAAGFSIILARATFLHQKNIKPSLLIKLSNANLMGLVKSSYDIYNTASIWLIFIWIGILTVFLNIVLLKTEIWVGIVALISGVVFTTLLLQDVSREISLSRKNLGKHQAF